MEVATRGPVRLTLALTYSDPYVKGSLVGPVTCTRVPCSNVVYYLIMVRERGDTIVDDHIPPEYKGVVLSESIFRMLARGTTGSYSSSFYVLNTGYMDDHLKAALSSL